MSRLIARILLTVLIFPAATLFYFVSFILIERWVLRDDEAAIVWATVLTCMFMAGYWLMLWFRSVAWTRARVGRTLWSVGGAVFAGGVIGVLLSHSIEYTNVIGTCLGALCAVVIWIIATIFVWRETEAERAARLARAGADVLVCPACGYNLTGLRESRCPECGASFTLNELLAAQPSRAPAEIETAS
jgi:hypothetical protein